MSGQHAKTLGSCWQVGALDCIVMIDKRFDVLLQFLVRNALGMLQVEDVDAMRKDPVKVDDAVVAHQRHTKFMGSIRRGLVWGRDHAVVKPDAFLPIPTAPCTAQIPPLKVYPPRWRH